MQQNFTRLPTIVASKNNIFIAIVGISFTDLLIFIQMGFEGALYDSAKIPDRNLNGDLMIGNTLFDFLYLVFQVRSINLPDSSLRTCKNLKPISNHENLNCDVHHTVDKVRKSYYTCNIKGFLVVIFHCPPSRESVMFNRSLIAPAPTAPLRAELCGSLGFRLARLIRLHSQLFQSQMLGQLPQHS